VVNGLLKVIVSSAAKAVTVVPGGTPTPVTNIPVATLVVEATLITVCPTASSASSVVETARLDDVSKSKSISAILIS
jgi:hypothetical protein